MPDDKYADITANEVDPFGVDDKKTADQRLTTLEHALFGDQVAIAKFKKAVETYVTPRGPQPPEGLLVRMQRQVDEAIGRYADLQGMRKEVDEYKKEVARLRAFLAPLDIGGAPLDGNQIATKAFVDAGLERLAGRLREEVATVGGRLETARGHIQDQVNTLRTSVRVGFELFAHNQSKKTRRRLREALGLWRATHDERVAWIFTAIEDGLRR